MSPGDGPPADPGGRLPGDRRAEAEATERAAATAARRRRSLAELAAAAMARGETVVVALPGRRLTGPVVHATGDLISLRIPRGRADVSTTAPLTLRVLGPGAAGRAPDPGGPPSFRARLRELELAATPVEVGLVGADEPRRGVIAVVSRDHLLLEDADGRTAVALGAVTHVIEVRPADGPLR